MKYNFAEFESKWQQAWEDKKVFTAKDNPQLPKYYCLEMFPYPSGNIHMGHVRNYSIGDAFARYKMMLGFNVLHPIGWDAFGLPAENAAKQNNSSPADWTEHNIASMKKQLKSLGLSYDWDREINTSSPDYYKWEQKLFIEMWKKGLAYKKRSEVNWCDSCETVLANEQVEDGLCWRCSGAVVKKDLEQWFFKITDYADELYESTYDMEGNWPDKVLSMQRNWIGKSKGAEISFNIKNTTNKLTVFTTRPDTIFGVTAILICADHQNLREMLRFAGRYEDGIRFINDVLSEHAEMSLNPQLSYDNKEKKGFNTGIVCINPANGDEIPLYIANYILSGYGTGVVMAVPAHDDRDFEFATKYNIPIKAVIAEDESKLSSEHVLTQAYTGEGVLINSDQFNGLTSDKAKSAIIDSLEKRGVARTFITYKLRDWGVSRQRYWGSPIPFVHCPKCGLVPVEDKDLPVTLPKDVNFKVHGNPLDHVESFVNVHCPKCGTDARRETDTMDTFVESSWYYLRYCSPKSETEIFNKKLAEYWMPVDEYIGGVEHAVMHLLYARFFTKVFRDLGYLNFNEPFKNLLTQGMVSKETYKCPEHSWLFSHEVVDGKCVHCSKDVIVGRVEKMSKSKKNVVEPGNLITKYGADSLRLFSLFTAPPDKEFDWFDSGLEGCHRFVNRVYRLVMSSLDILLNEQKPGIKPLGGLSDQIAKDVHTVAKKVTLHMEKLQFNTAIAAIMEYVNSLYIYQKQLATAEDKTVFKGAILKLIKLLTPFTPHLSEELWSISGNDGFVSKVPWPTYSEQFIISDSVNIVVQINGKVREQLTLPRNISEDEVFKSVFESSKVQSYISGKTIVKKIYVPLKLVSLVIK